MKKRTVFLVGLLLFCFSLMASELHLVAPQNGEVLQAGQACTVSWEAKDLQGEIRLVLYKEGRYYANIGMVPVAPGSYVWSIPETTPTDDDYSLRIYQGQVSDMSDRCFSIAAPACRSAGASTAAGPGVYVPSLPDELVTARTRDGSGRELMVVNINGRPPSYFRADGSGPSRSDLQAIAIPSSATMISDVPAYSWSFGCSATSAAMIAAYYDRHGFPYMYDGPTDGGVAPIDNSCWGITLINTETRALCPISATRNGLDGRSVRGHVDDYWIKSGNEDNDPYITNGWVQHAYEDCTGDFMKTNQSAYGNADGSTLFYYWPDGAPFSEDYPEDGGYGFELFMESRGYTVSTRYTQTIVGYNGNATGFSLAQYKAEIDAGRPVIIQVEGHTMVGVGYDTASSLIYLHNTWDYSTYSMTWGGSYEGMQMWGVVVLNLFPPALTVKAPNGGESWVLGATKAITWTATNYLDTVSLILYNGDTKVGVIASGLNAATGSYSWTVGQYSGGTAATGANYKIRIRSADNSLTDSSNAAFTIAPVPSLDLKSPNGGESWTLGTAKAITWTAANYTGTVNLVLYNGSTKVGVIVSGLSAASGSYSWTVGHYSGGTAAAGSNYKIRIRSADNTVYDASANAFAMVPASQLTVTSPNGGENWTRGTSHAVTWTTSGYSGTVSLILYNGLNKVGVIASGLNASSGSYSWTAGQYAGGTAPAGSSYVIRIRSADNLQIDSSDAYFGLAN